MYIDFRAAIIHRLVPRTNYTRQLNEGFEEIGCQKSIILYGWKKEKVKNVSNANLIWTPLLYPFQIFKRIFVDKPSIVHLQYEFATFGPIHANILLPLLLLLLKLTRVKMVVTIHSVIPYSVVNDQFVKNFVPSLQKLPLIKLLLKIFFIDLYKIIDISADLIYVHGDWYKQTLIDSYRTKAKIQVIPYGVSDRVENDSKSFDYYKNLFDSKKIILSFGSVSPRKDLEGLIRSFEKFSKRHPDYVLVIAGNSTIDFRWYGERLKKIALDLGLEKKVTFLGFVDDTEIHALYRISEFLVLPYIYGFEGPSGPLAFAIQHGLPIVGTNVGHLREEIRNLQEGLLVPVGDVSALDHAMETLANNPQLRKCFSTNITKKNIGSTWRDMAIETLSSYKRLSKDGY